MDVLTILFGLAFLAGGSALGWRMWTLETSLLEVKESTSMRIDEQKKSTRSSLVALHHTIASLEAGAQALLSTQPQLSGRIALHSAIARSESVLDRGEHSTLELQAGGEALITALRNLVGAIRGDGSLEEGTQYDVYPLQDCHLPE